MATPNDLISDYKVGHCSCDEADICGYHELAKVEPGPDFGDRLTARAESLAGGGGTVSASYWSLVRETQCDCGPHHSRAAAVECGRPRAGRRKDFTLTGHQLQSDGRTMMVRYTVVQGRDVVLTTSWYES